MKSTILYAFLLLLPASLNAAEQVTVEVKFIESSKGAVIHDLAKLAITKGIDLISAPNVTTKSGQQATFEVLREHQPASVAFTGFKSLPVGITVRVTPRIKGDSIAYAAHLSISELVTDKAPEEHTLSEISSRDLYVSGTPKDGEVVWFDFIDPSNKKNIAVWMRLKTEAEQVGAPNPLPAE